MYQFHVDLSQFEDLPAPTGYHDIPRLTVSESGRVAMNAAMQRAVGTQRDFRAKVYDNLYYFALCLEEPYTFSFAPKNGMLVHKALALELKQQGYKFPVTYTMEWHPEQNAWIGGCQELAQPPAFSGASKQKRGAGQTGGKV